MTLDHCGGSNPFFQSDQQNKLDQREKKEKNNIYKRKRLYMLKCIYI